MSLRSVVVVDAVRTPFGKYGGALKDVRPDDLAAQAIRALFDRTGVDPRAVGDVYWGAANQAGEDNRNVGRLASLLAGLPVEVPGVTVNRLCGSGLQAVSSAAREIQVGSLDVAVAGGSESMTRAPLVMLKPESAFGRGNTTMYDSTLGWRMTNARLAELYPPVGLGETAENVARDCKVSRADQDAFALRSHQRAASAGDHGRFAAQMLPVPVRGRKGEVTIVDVDEGIRRDTSIEQLGRLPSAFAEGGTVTAGNSSQLNDGASALLLVSSDYARDHRLTPLLRFVDAATAGVNPSHMGLGPVPATRKLLARQQLAMDEVDLVEINEAFAAQALACIRELRLDEERVNPNGGAIAIGHPLGASGARLVTDLAYELQRREGRYGLVTMCIGVGQGISALFECIHS